MNREGTWIEQQPYAYWLALLKGIGTDIKLQMEAYAGSPKSVYQMSRKELRWFLTAKKAELFLKKKEEDCPHELWEKRQQGSVGFYPYCHPEYPSLLRQIPDPPYALYVEGRLPAKDRPAVAVIGARNCSTYGMYLAEQCGRELAQLGVSVISGMASGIDGMSQRAALEAGGDSYGVLGCGPDICYPEEHRLLYGKLKERGGIISELLPGTPPHPGHFPRRNRIISGLSHLVLIIEAREKSGTLITADLALEQGRDVYVVPGRITDPLSRGCNRLLKQGAGLMTGIREMLEESGLLSEGSGIAMGGSVEDTVRGVEGRRGVDGESAREKIWNALDFAPKTSEMLAKETGISYGEMMFILVDFCLEGLAAQVSAGQFVKKKETLT